MPYAALLCVKNTAGEVLLSEFQWLVYWLAADRFRLLLLKKFRNISRGINLIICISKIQTAGLPGNYGEAPPAGAGLKRLFPPKAKKSPNRGRK